MTTKMANRNTQQASEQKWIVGLQKHEQTLPSLTIGGTLYKTADIVSMLQTLVNSAQTVISSRATWQANIVADEAVRAKNKAVLSGLRQSLFMAFGNSVDVLADFGMTPRKGPAARTPEEKAAITAKAAATRAARHTMGKKQKAQIKGSAAPPAPAVASGAVTPQAGPEAK
jgi:hypothetical protein